MKAMGYIVPGKNTILLKIMRLTSSSKYFSIYMTLRGAIFRNKYICFNKTNFKIIFVNFFNLSFTCISHISAF
jgi:hypothetical protein